MGKIISKKCSGYLYIYTYFIKLACRLILLIRFSFKFCAHFAFQFQIIPFNLFFSYIKKIYFLIEEKLINFCMRNWSFHHFILLFNIYTFFQSLEEKFVSYITYIKIILFYWLKSKIKCLFLQWFIANF